MNVSVSASPKLAGYLALGGLGLLGGILLGRPEASAIGIAFLGALVAGIALAEAPRLSLQARLDRGRTIEGDEVTVDLEVESDRAVPWLQLLVPMPTGIDARAGAAVQTVRLRPGVRRKLSVTLVPRHWGVYNMALVVATAHDRLGFFTFESLLRQELTLRVFPREEVLAQAIRPLETQAYSGNELSSRKGDGIEFADVRPFVPGDRVRRINWRVSTRLGQLHVNEFHPERNTDVVLFLDTFSDFGSDRDSTLLMAVRATASLARHYLSRRDRVALVSFGGMLRWLPPSMGAAQAYRIVDALLDTETVLSYAWKGIEVIPTRTLPPKALVVAITPLMDERTLSALVNLWGRGFDHAIVEVTPAPFVRPPRDELERLAYRLWQLKREALRHGYQKVGVPVATWGLGDPLAAALEEVRRYRRFARTSRAW